MDIKSYIQSDIIFQGSSTDRFLRFVESVGQFNGAFLQFEGAANKFHIGVHDAGDDDPLNDTKVVTIQRADGFIGINTETPNFELDLEGTFRNEGARISPTFTDITSRLSVGTPSFGSSRLGDSDLQTDTLDVGTSINFKTTGQVTQWAAFANAVGNTLTWRHVQNPTALFSIQNDAAAATRGVTDVESTFGLVTQYSNGDSLVFDLFNQEYIANGSILAQSQGINMIAPTGGHRKFGIYRSDSGLTNIRRVMEVAETGAGDVVEFFQPIKAPNGVAADDLATIGQIPSVANFVEINTSNETSSGLVTSIGRAAAEQISLQPAAARVRIFGGSGTREFLEVDAGGPKTSLSVVDQQSSASNVLVSKGFTDLAYEDDLGNPTSDGQILSSTTAGVRSWVNAPSGGVSQSSGTFTPTLVDVASGATYTFTPSVAQWNRIGDMVWFTCFLFGINTSGTPLSQLQLSGLPFSSAFATALSVSLFDGGDQNFNSVVAQLTSSNIVFPIQNATDSSLGGGGTPALTIGPVTFTNGRILVSGVYTTTDP